MTSDVGVPSTHLVIIIIIIIIIIINVIIIIFIVIIIIINHINSFDTVYIGEFYLVWLPLVKQIRAVGKIVLCLVLPTLTGALVKGCIPERARAPHCMLTHCGPVTSYGTKTLN